MRIYRLYWNDGIHEDIIGSNFIMAFINSGHTLLDYFQSLICWERIC